MVVKIATCHYADECTYKACSAYVFFLSFDYQIDVVTYCKDDVFNFQ